MIDPHKVKSIFLAATERPPTERAAFLDEIVAGDIALRERLKALLAAHDDPNTFLDQHAAEIGMTADLSPPSQLRVECPGASIGPYKLLEQIGEGGMGAVFMAEQQTPVRRRVALKIIKAGMDTRQIVARFEAERQALALMDHANIARVLDAGATDSGRPYFVMELVRGVPITEYCDQNNLSVRDRLELFVQVCYAVQHAHQKGIIHRDLKPTNVLVTVNDGRAVPKVIDFGVAKATNQQLTEKTLFTAFAQMIGTPPYMSPEQAEMSSVDIDTRSDIYSLGVLLYELLTGMTPFGQQRLREAAHAEMVRIIREEEPPKPSTRISTAGEARTAIAAHRQVDPRRLDQIVRGDLDWIVMKCLEKDRARRYDSANDLAADVIRSTSGEAVQAVPPNRTYRLRKFVQRHKEPVAASGLVAGALVLGVIGTSVGMIQAQRAGLSEATQRKLAETARKAEADRADGERAARQQAELNFEQAREAVDHMTTIAEERLMDPSQLAKVRRDMLEDAAKFYEAFVQERGSDPTVILQAAKTHRRAGALRYEIGQPWDAEKHYRQAITLVDALSKTEPEQAEYRNELGHSYVDIGRLYHHELSDPVAAERAYRQAKDVYRPLFESLPDDHVAQFSMFWASMELASVLMTCDRDTEAMVELKQALRIAERFSAREPENAELTAQLAQVRHRIGDCLARSGSNAEAEAQFRTAILSLVKIHTANPEDESTTYLLTQSKQYLAGVLTDVGRPKEGEALIREVIAEIEPIAKRRSEYNLMATHLAYCFENLGNALLAQGRIPAAHDAYIQGRDGLRRIYEVHPDAPARTLAVLYPLAFCQDESVRDPAAAANIARGAFERAPRVQAFSIYLGAALYETGDWNGATLALRKAENMGPKDLGFARYILALAEFRGGQMDAARTSLEQAEHWASVTPQRFREPRIFAAEARQTILGREGNGDSAPNIPNPAPDRPRKQ